MWFLTVIGILAATAVFVAWRTVRRKQIHKIVIGDRQRHRERYHGTRHVFFCFVDHFEPLWRGADRARGIERVSAWRDLYPKSVDRFRDNGGRPPQHTFFYPQEEYIPQCIDDLARLRHDGYGDVEIHLHHDADTSEGFRGKIVGFRDTLHDRHGLLHENSKSGRIEYGFIHGNWALDDSGVNGRWCGVKDEITILKETGCYADFTYPSAPHPSQPPMVNRIYYAVDDPMRAKSHHRGTDAAYRTAPAGDLLLVTGPLALNWTRRKRGLLPTIENSDITGQHPPTPDRVDLWVRTNIHVRSWPRWTFIKVHTHGTQEDNAGLLLGPRIATMYEYLLNRYNDGHRWVLHFVTARELYRCIGVLEGGDDARISRVENFDYSFE